MNPLPIPRSRGDIGRFGLQKALADATSIAIYCPNQPYMKLRLFIAFVSAFCVFANAADETPPTIVQVQPAPGTVTSLTNITVRFSEQVEGISRFDLLMNGQAAGALSGADDTWTFSFAQPAHGTIQIGWDQNHTIVDLAGNRFEEKAAGSTWQYNFVDTAPPVMTLLAPAAGVTVRQLTQIEVQFNEPVTGVDAGDLSINGTAASSMSVLGEGRYRFTFPEPPIGIVQAAWAANHQIRDFANPPNAFAGGNWTYTLDPAAGIPDVRINEFLAGNVTGLRDENAEYQDWIEIHNRGANAVNLGGWSLTDDPNDPGKWVFPSTNLAAGGYLVLFASGKDRRAPTGTNRFHTNFKLGPSGDYLGLFNGELPRVAMTEFASGFPEQRNDHSYGYDSSNALKYFSTPTPGAANGASQISGIVPPVHFNVQRGMFETPFTLHLSCDVPDATIRFTTDGSEPTASTGTVYTGPMEVTNTAVIRAIATRANMLPSATVTHTYLFLEQVLRQPNNPAGFPTNWGGTNIQDVVAANATFSPGTTIPLLVPADYEMDMDPLRVDPNNTNSPIDAVKLQRLKDGLRELPVMSVVMKVDDMFGTNGLYQRSADETGSPGTKPQNEKPCSLEMILPDGTTAFATTCGIDLHGNASRNPTKNPKHGFKLVFKGDYGSPTLDYRLFEDSPVREYDDVLLRPDFNSSWRHWSDTAGQGLGAFQRTRAVRIRDAWMKETMRDMGELACHSRFVHLYVNGLYWGTFDLSEDPTDVFAKNNLGGSSEDFDVVDQGVIKNGTITAYNAMVALPAATTLAQYEQFHQYLNVTAYVDYMLLHFFIGHQDWATANNSGTKNWSAIRKRVPGAEGTFRYIPWDGECILLNEDVNRTALAGTDYPSGLHGDLLASPEYRLLFADRIHRHMFAPDGALTRETNIARWQKWQAIMDKPIVAESVRWGDYRRDVHNSSEGTYQLYTREGHWLPENARMLTYFTNRPNIVLTQLRAANLYPSVSAPVLSQHGGRVARNFGLTMTASNAMYYTLDNSDPREYGTGAIAAGAITYNGSPVVLTNSVIVKARALFGANWSALAEARFQVAELGPTIRITEIMYNPVDGDAYEYLVLKNIGTAALNLGGYSFDGINYVFAPGAVIAPGATIVLGSNNNPAGWTNRYPSLTAFAFFGGNLSNGGEKVSIKDPDGNIVYSLDYDDENGWDTAADGRGPSLKVADPLADADDPGNWSSAGPVASAVVLNEVFAASSTSSDWVELRNASGAPINLGGWSITDDGDARKYIFPGSVSIPANGYLVVWCDSPTNTAPGPHTGFALDRHGETISLFNAATTRVDVITFGLQLADYSVGRTPSGWKLNTPTPNAANIAATTAATSNLSINEWLANTPPGGSDWIELFNRSASAPVALQGIFLGNGQTVHQLNSLSFIAPQGFVQLFASELAGPDQLDFKLSAAGGSIALYDESAIEIERVTYGPQNESVTQGRSPDGTATIATFTGSASPGTNNYVITYTGPRLNEISAEEFVGYVELYNASGSAFDLSGMRLTSDLNDLTQYVFEPGTTIAANGYFTVIQHDWLNHSGGAVYLLNTNGQVLDSVTYGFQAPGYSIGRVNGEWQLGYQIAGSPTLPAELGSPNLLRINEWLANSVDEPDWFELYNPDSKPVLLSGLYATDDPSLAGRTQFQFPPLSFIAPKGFVKVIADSDPSEGPEHATFSLSDGGDSLRLLGPSLNIIDSVYFGQQVPGVSQGRLPDGADQFAPFPQTATPARSNYLPLDNARINEVSNAVDGKGFIELYNPSGSGVDLSGWYLSHDPSDYKIYRIPDGTFLPAGGYLLFNYADVLPDGSESLFLSEADKAGNLSGRRSSLESESMDGVFGVISTCSGNTAAAILTFATPGSFNAPPRIPPVVINEIMYHPPGPSQDDNNIDEYIELHAPDYDVSLRDVELRNAVNYTFPTNAFLPAGGFVVVVGFDPVSDLGQLALFRVKFGVPDEVDVFGPWRGNLNNAGESVELAWIERVLYDDAAPWPVSGDGDGNSLQRIDPRTLGNDPANWQAAPPSAGQPNPSPEPQPPMIVTHPLSRAVPSGTRVEFNVVVCGAEVFPYRWMRDGVDIPGASLRTYTIPSATAADEGAYSVRVRNAAGSVTSLVATLTIQSPPVITQEPQSVLTASGTNVSFTVAASGSGPFTYQWRKNGIALSGKINATLDLLNVQIPDSGDYSVLVGNAAGAVASAVANLEVFQRVRILTHPASRTVNTNTAVTFSVTASGTGTLRYQWRYMGADLQNQTNATLDIASVQLEDSGDYTVLVYDNRSSAESLPATLAVLVRPSVLRHPQGITVAVGSNVTLSAGVYGGWPLTNRWRRGSANVYTNILSAKQTNTTFPFPNIQTNQAAGYAVGTVNGGGSSLLSSNAFITVVVPPTNITVNPGSDARFTAQAFGITRILYQWKAGNTDIAGATNTTLIVSNVQSSQAGTYSVVVSAITNTVIPPATFSATLTVQGSAPVLSEPRLLSASEFQFLLTGDSNTTYAIQFSSDLTNWTTFTNIPYTEPVTITDRPPPADRSRFYRARAP